MKPINIIGAGMAGSLMAKLLRKNKIRYRIFDANKPGAASKISENLVGLKWYKDEAKDLKESMLILRELVPTRLINGKFLHVLTGDLLEHEYFPAKIILKPEGAVDEQTGIGYEGFNLVCAGVWTTDITDLEVQAIAGHGLIMPGQTSEEKILSYRPFKFNKFFNRSLSEIQYSNSLETKAGTYMKFKDKFRAEIYENATKFTNLDWSGATYQYGYRPKTFTHNNLMIENGIIITGGRAQGLFRYPLQCNSALEFIKRNKKFL